jgi:hypothetical protein
MQIAINKSTGLIIDILPDDHSFSTRERELFDIASVADSDIEKMNAEIDNYYKTNMAIGGTEIKGIEKYYIDGVLSWQTVQ